MSCLSKFFSLPERVTADTDLCGATRIKVEHNSDLEEVDLTGVKLITFLGDFNRPLDRVDLKDVECLNFLCGKFNQSLVGVDFKNVTDLVLLGDYNQSLVGVDFGKIRRLQLGPNFVDPSHVGVNFGKIQVLDLGNFYDKSLVGVDFGEVRDLRLGHTYNRPLVGVDLKNVRTLHLGVAFKRPLAAVDFKNVERLTLRFEFPLGGLMYADLGKIQTIEWERWESDGEPLVPDGFILDPKGCPGPSSRRDTVTWSMYRVDRSEPKVPKSELCEREVAIVRAKLDAAVRALDEPEIEKVFAGLTGTALKKAIKVFISSNNLSLIGKVGSIGMIEKLISRFELCPQKLYYLADGAAENGRTGVLKVLIDKHRIAEKLNKCHRSDVFIVTVCSGKVACAKYIANSFGIDSEDRNLKFSTEGILDLLSEEGHLDMLKWLVEDFKLGIDRHANNPNKIHDSMFHNAALGGHVNVLRWIVATFCDKMPPGLAETSTIRKEVSAACLRHRCPTTMNTARRHSFLAAATGGRLDVLKYLVSEFGIDVANDSNDRMRQRVQMAYEEAERGGHTETMDWIADTFALSSEERVVYDWLPSPTGDPDFDNFVRKAAISGCKVMRKTVFPSDLD